MLLFDDYGQHTGGTAHCLWLHNFIHNHINHVLTEYWNTRTPEDTSSLFIHTSMTSHFENTVQMAKHTFRFSILAAHTLMVIGYGRLYLCWFVINIYIPALIFVLPMQFLNQPEPTRADFTKAISPIWLSCKIGMQIFLLKCPFLPHMCPTRPSLNMINAHVSWCLIQPLLQDGCIQYLSEFHLTLYSVVYPREILLRKSQMNERIQLHLVWDCNNSSLRVTEAYIQLDVTKEGHVYLKMPEKGK